MFGGKCEKFMGKGKVYVSFILVDEILDIFYKAEL